MSETMQTTRFPGESAAYREARERLLQSERSEANRPSAVVPRILAWLVRWRDIHGLLAALVRRIDDHHFAERRLREEPIIIEPNAGRIGNRSSAGRSTNRGELAKRLTRLPHTVQGYAVRHFGVHAPRCVLHLADDCFCAAGRNDAAQTPSAFAVVGDALAFLYRCIEAENSALAALGNAAEVNTWALDRQKVAAI